VEDVEMWAYVMTSLVFMWMVGTGAVLVLIVRDYIEELKMVRAIKRGDGPIIDADWEELS
jgi:hypothetical protein